MIYKCIAFFLHFCILDGEFFLTTNNIFQFYACAIIHTDDIYSANNHLNIMLNIIQLLSFDKVNVWIH
jgi:hypothetical protein